MEIKKSLDDLLICRLCLEKINKINGDDLNSLKMDMLKVLSVELVNMYTSI